MPTRPNGDDDNDDEALRAELRALHAATPEPRAGLTDAVMQRLALRPRRRSWWQTLSRRRRVTIEFRLTQLLAASAVAALVGTAALRSLRPSSTAPVHTALAQPASNVVAPGPVLVRFSLPARDAQTVSVAGDFNGWRAGATPLTRGPDGVFTATVPLEPGSWSYSFVVDGKWVEDPFADAYRADGFGGRNAVLRIGGG